MSTTDTENLVRGLFDADAAHLFHALQAHVSTCGFSIPEYQRDYSWDADKVKRLIESCLNGFHHLADKNREQSVTFLGTLILINDQHPEPNFDGTSLFIVDGQQRLTTLVLLFCALVEEINSHKEDASQLRGDVKRWIEKECEHQIDCLCRCTNGELRNRNDRTAFPKIVRETNDGRGIGGDADYNSPIAKFLHSFAEFYENGLNEFRFTAKNKKDQKLLEIYRKIKEWIHALLYEGNQTHAELDWEPIERNRFGSSNLKSLFDKLSTIEKDRNQDKAVSVIEGTPEITGLVRLILFSSYMTSHVVLTNVKTSDENSAFDIFDALNTTGEPLTALETFKPYVVKCEKKLGRGYQGSESCICYEAIEKSLNSIASAAKRQTETKELLTSFALYYDGTKLPHDLNAQRRYLQKEYGNLSAKEKNQNLALKRKFIESIKDLQEFRDGFWQPNGIKQLNFGCESPEVQDTLRLCLMFISAMKTSITIPVLARYYKNYSDDAEAFVSIVKAVTAFVALRRTATGGTENIEADFRRLMKSPPDVGGDPLCIGEGYKHTLISISSLKEELRKYLGKLEVLDKATWIEKARKHPLAKLSKPLCRFLIFAGAHNSRPDENNPGLRKKEIPSDELNFLSYGAWQNPKYGTVEHIAPVSRDGEWSPQIYEGGATIIHTLGNLILLPQAENASIGNSGWTKKKKVYEVLTTEKKEERERLLESLENREKERPVFQPKTKNLLSKQGHLPLLEPIPKVDEWNKTIIEMRTQNTLGLAWDNISPWLFD